MTTFKHKLVLGLALASTATFITADAFATEGYFQNGIGARHKAMAGAGVANTDDATAISLNPAGIVGAGHELDVAVSLFAPVRRFTGIGGPGFTTNGEVISSEELFAIPNIAYSRPLSDTSAIGFSVSGNGGMNSNYRNVTNPACVSPPLPANNGVFCGGTAGVNLNQLFISIGYAKQFDKLKIGIAPIVAIQLFEATGLFAFGGATVNPGALSNNGASSSSGVGGRIGLEYAISDGLKLGATYQTKINMSEFDGYAGLFADGGDFDIPSNFQVGIAASVMENLTVMLDYRHIKYSDAPSVSNSSRIPLPFGSPGGPGFGWDNMDVYKIGAEWQANDAWKLRAGFSHNTQPISPDDVTLNLLAPGVVQNHFTGGGSVKVNDRNTIEFGVMHAPTDFVSGIEVTPGGLNPGHLIKIEMKQFEATIGWKMKFGG